MHNIHSEREVELAAAIAQQEETIRRLEEERDKLRSAVLTTAPLASGDQKATDKNDKFSDPDVTSFLESYPILEYCLSRARRSVFDIPIEHIGNVIEQLHIAQGAVRSAITTKESDLSKLRNALREQNRKAVCLSKEKIQIADESGIDVNAISDKARARIAREQEQDNSISLHEMNEREKLVRREIQLGRQLQARKSETICALEAKIDGQKAIINEIDEMYNHIRVIDRDIRIEEIALEELHADANNLALDIQAKIESQAIPQQTIIQQETARLRAQKLDVVRNQREPQERVIKAQTYRLQHLDARIKLVDKALRSNNLARDVQNIVADAWEKQTIEPPSVSEMYNMERIIPSQEKIHAGIYNLLLTEKEKTTRMISQYNIGLKEKEEVIGALSCEAEALARECTSKLEELDKLASDAAFAEEEHRQQALLSVSEQQAYYKSLCTERQRLNMEYIKIKNHYA